MSGDLRGKEKGGGGAAPENVMVTIKEHLWLDDGHQAGALVDGCIAGLAVSAVLDSHGRWSRWDGHHRPPLGEPGSLLVVLCGPLGEAVQALTPALAVGVGHGHQTLVHLDTCSRRGGQCPDELQASVQSARAAKGARIKHIQDSLLSKLGVDTVPLSTLLSALT